MTRKFLWVIAGLILSFAAQAQHGYDTLHVYFDLNKTELKPSQTMALETALQQVPHLSSARLLIYGYADYLGTEKSNYTLAEQRAATVAAYLKLKGITEEQILLQEGIGALPYHGKASPEGRPMDRRVDIFLRKQMQKTVDTVAAVMEEKIAQLKVNETLELPNILFVGGSHQLLPKSYGTLEILLAALQKLPHKKFVLEGHICCQIGLVGDGLDFDTGLPNLSVARAKMVYDYLVMHGIDAQSLRYKGFGSSRPKHNPEMTEQQRTENRRVEIRVVE